MGDYMYYACLMVKAGDADGVVSGACHSTANTLRPSLQIIKTKPGVKLVSAFFVMVVPNCEFGANGTFIFGDSGLVQNPSAEELAAIPVAASKLQADIIVPCTACDYCYECPSEIKISKIFAWYNEAAAKGFHWIWGSLSKEYEKLGPNATNCVECGNCEGHCPQKIGIIKKLKDIHKKYEELKEKGE